MPVTGDFDRFFPHLPPFDRQEDFDAFAELAHQLALSIELVGKPAS